MFHHDGKGRAHFGSGGKAGPTMPAQKVKGATMHEKGHAPHGDVGEKHVTETHPGKTEPHPHTGVHAFHAHHVGGGQYHSHTHHDDGTVESKQHRDHGDMMAAMHEALPPTDDADHDLRDGGESFGEELGAVGGTEEA